MELPVREIEEVKGRSRADRTVQERSRIRRLKETTKPRLETSKPEPKFCEPPHSKNMRKHAIFERFNSIFLLNRPLASLGKSQAGTSASDSSAKRWRAA